MRLKQSLFAPDLKTQMCLATSRVYIMNSKFTLPQLGWQPYFQQQLTLEDYEQNRIARVSAHHRSGYELLCEQGLTSLPIHHSLPHMTVGDWILIDSSNQFVRLLERSSLFRRKAAGPKATEQFIASNIDTVFVVCSLNQDFNLSRIERYLSIAHEAEVEAVVILTKADLCSDVDEKKAQVQALDKMLMIEVVNALDSDSTKGLLSWCKQSKTVAFLGSSGVGKSTLVNTLLNNNLQSTGSIREDDSKGRHTTTSRTLHMMPSGALLLDTPGMRELQLTDCESGVAETFADIEDIAGQCRFSDCLHQSEPGCAIQKALDAGTIDPRRVENYFKLMREQARNTATISEQRAHGKQLSKMYRTVAKESRSMKKGDGA